MQAHYFPVDVEIEEDGIYIFSCPVFEACHADGKSIDEALGGLGEVIEVCFEEQSVLQQI